MFAAVLVVGAVAGCSSSAEASKLTDPHQILTQSLTSMSGAKSVHVNMALNGTLKLDSLSGLGGSSSLGMTSITLDNTTMDGDVDITTQAAQFTIAIPSLMGLKMDVIVVDGYTYYKSSIGGAGDKYIKQKNSAVVPEASALPSGSQTVQQLTDELKKQLDDAGITPQLKGTDKVNGQDAYHVVVPMPLDKINKLISDGIAANPSASLPSDIKLDSASIDVWSYVKDNRLAKAQLKGSSPTLGSLDLTLTMTNYDKAVSIKAPPADQVTEQ